MAALSRFLAGFPTMSESMIGFAAFYSLESKPTIKESNGTLTFRQLGIDNTTCLSFQL